MPRLEDNPPSLEDNPQVIARMRQAKLLAAELQYPAIGALLQIGADALEHAHAIAVGAWQPIATCPENTRVLFGWAGEGMTEHGRMQRNVERLSGERKHHFWGYPSCNDDYPPTHWQPAIEGPLA
jgi:hypothetical protein